MPSVIKSINVAVPIATAYNQWTQFEYFPNFMGGVDFMGGADSVSQTDAQLAHGVVTWPCPAA